MQDRGFIFAFEPPATDNFDPLQRRWGVAQMADAQHSAFALPPQVVANPAASAESQFRNSLTPAQQIAFDEATVRATGDRQTATIRVAELGLEQSVEFTASSDSCSTEGLIDAFGSFAQYAEFEAYRRVLADAINSFDTRAATSVEFTNALATWRTCLAKAGYIRGADPVVFTESYADDPSGPEAIQAAVADVRCKDEASLLPICEATLAYMHWTDYPASTRQYNTPTSSATPY